MAPYSLDLRQKILQAYAGGGASQRELAERFVVSLSFVEKLLMQQRRTGHVEPKPHAGGKPSRIDVAARLQLQQWLAQQPDLTLAELAERLHHTLHIRVSSSRLCGVLQELGMPRKKSHSMQASAIRRK
jgi:transposase